MQSTNFKGMKIEKGGLNGLIDPNGAGKTTVFNLLTGVYKPNEGIAHHTGRRKYSGQEDDGRSTKAGIRADAFQKIGLFKDMDSAWTNVGSRTS